MDKITAKEIIEATGGTLLHGSEDCVITFVGIHSKEMEENGLFVPIIGERVDAHLFIEDAFSHGASAAFTSKPITAYQKGKTYIQVEDTITALQALAEYYRSKFQIPVIGITGSVGKTTTKEMIAASLETTYSIYKTKGNQNSQIGLPLTILGIEHTHQAAVIEMGMSEEGEMYRLAKIARPTMAVVTNIGVSHIGQLGTKENIRKEKLRLIDFFSEEIEPCSNLLFLNGNDTLLKEITEYKKLTEKAKKTNPIALADKTKESLEHTTIVTFGTKKEQDYYAKEIRIEEEELHFVAVHEKEEEEIILSVLGEHNIRNALVSLAIAQMLHIPMRIAKQGLKQYQPIAMRGQKIEQNGITYIDDTYNASPDSMKSAVHVLLDTKTSGKRWVVFADVLELGEVSKQCHYEVGTYLVSLFQQGKAIEELITIGEEAKEIARAVQNANTTIQVHVFSNNEEAAFYLKQKAAKGDTILLKGSRGMHTEQILKAMIEQ